MGFMPIFCFITNILHLMKKYQEGKRFVLEPGELVTLEAIAEAMVPVLEKGEPTTQEIDDGVKIIATVEVETEEIPQSKQSGRSARASRREKRAAEAEMKQVLEEMHKAIGESGLPPLPAPGELPLPGELPPLPEPGELPPLPDPGELPPLPTLGDLPPLPELGDLPPLPDLPAPEIPVNCEDCDSTFTARANKARRVKCPLCGATVKL